MYRLIHVLKEKLRCQKYTLLEFTAIFILSRADVTTRIQHQRDIVRSATVSLLRARVHRSLRVLKAVLLYVAH
jgi:energy-converting hydrogenase Eha subunit H